MLFFPVVTVEDGGRNSDPPSGAGDSLPVWTRQLLDRGTGINPIPPIVITEPRFPRGSQPPIVTTPFRRLPLPGNIGDPIITPPPDISGGASINPAPPDNAHANDARTTPTPPGIPAPTSASIETNIATRDAAAAAQPKLSRNEIIALVVLGALVIL